MKTTRSHFPYLSFRNLSASLSASFSPFRLNIILLVPVPLSLHKGAVKFVRGG